MVCNCVGEPVFARGRRKDGMTGMYDVTGARANVFELKRMPDENCSFRSIKFNIHVLTCSKQVNLRLGNNAYWSFNIQRPLSMNQDIYF